METGYKVGDIMTTEIHSVEKNSSIVECAKKMAENKVGSLIVKSEGEIIGIITEQDVSRKVLAEDLDPKETAVSQIMSSVLHKVEPDTDIHKAMELMGEKEIKHLPVLSGGEIRGIVTFKDIIKIEPTLIELLNFKNSMNED